jgi:alkylated DNA nucleotide flippase Atl1
MNPHDFPKEVVDRAAHLMHRWFEDEELGWCRVVKLEGAVVVQNGAPEATMVYTYLDEDGVEMPPESSSLEEVEKWVAEETSNI